MAKHSKPEDGKTLQSWRWQNMVILTKAKHSKGRAGREKGCLLVPLGSPPGLQNLQGQTSNAVLDAFRCTIPKTKDIFVISGSSFIGKCSNIKTDFLDEAWCKITQWPTSYTLYQPCNKPIFVSQFLWIYRPPKPLGRLPTPTTFIMFCLSQDHHVLPSSGL